jgi:hypothetical protein
MTNGLRVIVAAMAAIALMTLSDGARAQAPVKQVKLTEKQIEGFIAAQKDISQVVEKMQSAGDKPDPKLQAELDSIAKKHGFKDFSEYDDVAANISMVMAGIDPQTKAFTDPQVAIKKEIEEITADKSVPEKERKQMLEELNEALKSAQPIQYPSNIELVKKYWDKLDAVLQ